MVAVVSGSGSGCSSRCGRSSSSSGSILLFY